MISLICFVVEVVQKCYLLIVLELMKFGLNVSLTKLKKNVVFQQFIETESEYSLVLISIPRNIKGKYLMSNNVKKMKRKNY